VIHPHFANGDYGCASPKCPAKAVVKQDSRPHLPPVKKSVNTIICKLCQKPRKVFSVSPTKWVKPLSRVFLDGTPEDSYVGICILIGYHVPTDPPLVLFSQPRPITYPLIQNLTDLIGDNASSVGRNSLRFSSQPRHSPHLGSIPLPERSAILLALFFPPRDRHRFNRRIRAFAL
jgi:hypothetical protein